MGDLIKAGPELPMVYFKSGITAHTAYQHLNDDPAWSSYVKMTNATKVPLHTVTYRHIPSHTVKYRHISLHAVTYRVAVRPGAAERTPLGERAREDRAARHRHLCTPQGT